MPLVILILALLLIPLDGCQLGAPPPVAVKDLHVLAIFENDSRDSVPPEQLAILKSTAPGSFIATVKSLAAKGPDGEPMIRIFDPNDPVDRDLEVFKKLWDHTKTSRKGDFWVVAVNGRKWKEGPLELNQAAQLQWLQSVIK